MALLTNTNPISPSVCEVQSVAVSDVPEDVLYSSAVTNLLPGSGFNATANACLLLELVDCVPSMLPVAPVEVAISDAKDDQTSELVDPESASSANPVGSVNVTDPPCPAAPTQTSGPPSTASTDAARTVVLEVVYSVLLESAIGSSGSNPPR